MNDNENKISQYFRDKMRLWAEARNESSSENPDAVVASILRIGPEPAMAFIVRALDPNDPWSGQVAWPGGRVEDADQSAFAAVCRETFEEIGVNLGTLDYLGAGNFLQAQSRRSSRPFRVQSHFFLLPESKKADLERDIKLDFSEVAQLFWVPLQHLFSKENHVREIFKIQDFRLEMPAIRIRSGGEDEHLLWGLTYRLLKDWALGVELQKFPPLVAVDSDFFSIWAQDLSYEMWMQKFSQKGHS